MEVLHAVGLYVLALVFVVAGVSHFTQPRFYERLLPLWIPAHRLLVGLSGIAEIAVGVGLLFAATRGLAAWGAVALLVLFLFVHLYMLVDREAGLGLPRWALWLRFIVQFGLIAWAWVYTN